MSWDTLVDFNKKANSKTFQPLSGGIDSCATAVIVYSMCRLVVQAIKDKNNQVIEDCQRITAQDLEWVLSATVKEVCLKTNAHSISRNEEIVQL